MVRPTRSQREGITPRRVTAWVIAAFVGGAVVALSFVGASYPQEMAEEAKAPEVVASVSDEPVRRPTRELPCTAPDEPTQFRLYSLAQQFEGLALTTILRRCDDSPFDPSNGRANFVSYIYGSCDPQPTAGDPEGGCAPPIEVQVWPACERSIADYGASHVASTATSLAQRRGVPSADFGDRIELYSDDSSVVVFAASPQLAERVVDGLMVAARNTPATDVAFEAETAGALPVPDDRSLTGGLPCARR